MAGLVVVEVVEGKIGAVREGVNGDRGEGEGEAVDWGVEDERKAVEEGE